MIAETSQGHNTESDNRPPNVASVGTEPSALAILMIVKVFSLGPDARSLHGDMPHKRRRMMPVRQAVVDTASSNPLIGFRKAFDSLMSRDQQRSDLRRNDIGQRSEHSAEFKFVCHRMPADAIAFVKLWRINRDDSAIVRRPKMLFKIPSQARAYFNVVLEHRVCVSTGIVLDEILQAAFEVSPRTEFLFAALNSRSSHYLCVRLRKDYRHGEPG